MKNYIKYYMIIVQGNAKGGVMYAPSDWPRPIAQDGTPVNNWEALTVELRDGDYRNFHMCVGQANLVSGQFKEVLTPFVTNTSDLEFLPIKSQSREYGNRTYFIMHFKKIFDVIDEKRTIYVPNSKSIIKPWLSFEKVRNLNIFNFRPFTNDVIVSDRIRKLLCQSNLNDGIEFQPVYSYIGQ